MVRSLSRVVFTLIGALVVAVVLLGVIATLFAIVFGVVATVVSVVVTVAVVSALLFAAHTLFSLLRRSDGDDRPSVDVVGEPTSARPTSTRRHHTTHSSEPRDLDPTERLREQYLTGELDETEFERRLELALESRAVETRLDTASGSHSQASDSPSNRDLLWDH